LCGGDSKLLCYRGESKDGALPERSEGGESGEKVLSERSELRNLTPILEFSPPAQMKKLTHHKGASIFIFISFIKN